MQALNLAKKTKTEIIAEYEKLVASFEESKGAVKTLFSPKNDELIVRSKNELTDEQAREAIKKLKTGVSEKLNDFSQNLGLSLGQILEQINIQVEKFSLLQKAIDIHTDRLKTERQIDISVEAIENLLGEFESRRNSLEQEINIKEKELVSETESKRKEWDREQEAYIYETKLKRQREEDAYRYEQNRREQELKAREENIKQQEGELAQLKKEQVEMPSQIEKQVTQKEQELKKNLEATYKQKFEEDKREWGFDKKMMETNTKNLEGQIKDLEIDLSLARKEADAANKKAQDLAVRVIESGAYRSKTENSDKAE